MESKIELTERLRWEGRWSEASVYKDTALRKFRAKGMKKAEAGEQAWEAMAKAYPPLPPAAPIAAAVAAEDPAAVEAEAQFDAEFRKLPDRAPVSTEIDWISAHPAMSMMSRTGCATVVLTVSDILDAPHGPAPSKNAVQALQNWANRPNKFFEMMLSEQKKQGDDSEHSKADPDPGLEEVKKLLSQIEGARLPQATETAA
ncbi:MAG: hypothetical protein ABSG68_16875 [Thermoguttaceae bacterium]|jgi:hypothetical protein